MKLKELVEQYGEYTVPDELIEKLEPPQPKSVWDLKKGMIINTLVEAIENPRCETCYYFNESNVEYPCAMGNDTSEDLCDEWALSFDEAEDIADVIMDFARTY